MEGMKGIRGSSMRLRALAGFVLLGVVVALGPSVFGGGGSGGPQATGSGAQDVSAMSPDERFAALSVASSNRCDLGAAELRRMPEGARLRGSCCSPMDRHRYGEQLRGLRHYRGIAQIPSDPYDVPVALAKRLLAYRDLPPTEGQRAVYRQAKEKSELGGPCCCSCWRWQAFRGQANYLIARRQFSATQVARVWELEEGCGGSHDHA